mgnify:CR=1 FL=1
MPKSPFRSEQGSTFILFLVVISVALVLFQLATNEFVFVRKRQDASFDRAQSKELFRQLTGQVPPSSTAVFDRDQTCGDANSVTNPLKISSSDCGVNKYIDYMTLHGVLISRSGNTKVAGVLLRAYCVNSGNNQLIYLEAPRDPSDAQGTGINILKGNTTFVESCP